jgi:hypothetical protein
MTNTYCPFIRETCKGNECIIVTLLGGLREKEEEEGEAAPRYEAPTERALAAFDRQERETPDWIKSATAEELAAEILDFRKREFPEDEHVTFHTAYRLFLNSKGIQEFMIPPDAQLKMERAVYLAHRETRREAEIEMKRRLEEEKEELPSLVGKCVDWAKANGLRRLTLADVDTFMLESDLKLMPETRRALYSMANSKLKPGR